MKKILVTGGEGRFATELKKIKTVPVKKLEDIYEYFNGI